MARNQYGMDDAQQVRQQIQQTFGSSGNIVSTSQIHRSLRNGVENLSGVSLNDVRVSRGRDISPINTIAYAQGTNIHLGGQESHLPHEAWHVVQQTNKPTLYNSLIALDK